MNSGEMFLEFLKLTVPSIVLAGTVYLMLNQYFKDEDKKRESIRLSDNQRTTLPLKLQAYERLTIYLERISVNNLIIRLKSQGMSGAELHNEIIHTVREEFEHNISQQIYVSHDVWILIQNAKEEIIKLANITFSRVGGESSALDYSKMMIDIAMKEEIPAGYKALLYLKREVIEIL